MKRWEIVAVGVTGLSAAVFVYFQVFYDPFSNKINRDVDQLMRDRQERSSDD